MHYLELGLPHYHRHRAIYVVQIIDTPTNLGRGVYVSFARFAFYIVRCGFDKHLYLTSCLNAHDHNTCIRLQTGCTARKWHYSKITFFVHVE